VTWRQLSTFFEKKDLAKAAKRSGNETGEGKIKIVIEGTDAYVAVVSDVRLTFVARNENFWRNGNKVHRYP
jgi:translation elongation factor EF-Ts